MHPVGRDFRAFMAVRSRYVEDHLAAAVAQGIRQYVVLGAGLDTFAWRNPFPALRVFEVDFPATQVWKKEMLAEAHLLHPPISPSSHSTSSTRPSPPVLLKPDSIPNSPLSSAGLASSPISPSTLSAPPSATSPVFRAVQLSPSITASRPKFFHPSIGWLCKPSPIASPLPASPSSSSSHPISCSRNSTRPASSTSTNGTQNISMSATSTPAPTASSSPNPASAVSSPPPCSSIRTRSPPV